MCIMVTECAQTAIEDRKDSNIHVFNVYQQRQQDEQLIHLQYKY